MLRCGIVGLPNVGKSTLFNALTCSYAAESANYPFCTIEPNTGMVTVPDERLGVLQPLANTQKVIPAIFEFVDIAGLVRGASKGEGLGNQFLSHIRQVDAIAHVVRCFENEDVIHVEGSVGPVRDIETITIELCLADLESIANRLPKLDKRIKQTDRAAEKERELYLKIQPILESGQWLPQGASNDTFDFNEQLLLKQSQLLTAKPLILVGNVAEAELAEPEQNPHYAALLAYGAQHNMPVLAVSAQIEAELQQLSVEEKAEYLADLGVASGGVDGLIRAAYDRLGLATYFTAGEKEVRAWTFEKGFTAPQCAGVIHTDFERGFIRAEVIGYDDYVAVGGEKFAREKGVLRSEGKEYLMKDGDVVHFRFNV